MKKKFIALFAACSMIATASVGLVQTAYADDVTVRIAVSDGATDDQKIVNLYYEGVEGLAALTGWLSFEGGTVTIDSFEITVPIDDGSAFKTQNKATDGKIWFSNANDVDSGQSASSADGKFATATITVPTDVDITVNFKVDEFYDCVNWDEFTIGTVTTTIPKKSAPTPSKVPAAVTKIDKQNNDEINGSGIYANQKADIYGVEITPNDDVVTGAKVAFGDNSRTLDFGGNYTGSGTVVFAVILASVSGDALPTLEEDNVTPIVATIE